MTRRREQSGYIYARSGWWWLRYRETINQGGQLRKTHRAVRLAAIDVTHKTKKSLKDLAKEKLTGVNDPKRVPESVVTVGDFVRDIYLPFVVAQKRASTRKGYTDMWEDHLKARMSDMLLRDVRTRDVQRLLETIASEDKTKQGLKLSHETLKHIKCLLSGIFAHAKRQGFFDGVNPVADTAIPPSPKRGDTYAYALEEITRMLMLLPEPAATIVSTAAFTGARRGEIRGIMWENYHDGAIYIERSVWESHVNEPKTKASKAPVPIISPLAAMLEAHRVRSGNPRSGVLFLARNGQPLSLNNVLTRQIKPALNRCALCSKSAMEHSTADHNFKRDESLPKWYGWHAFRRGLATNLNRMGVQDKTIQAILRHSNLSTTMNVYVKSVDADAVTAMKTLETLMCAKRAPGAAVFSSNCGKLTSTAAALYGPVAQMDRAAVS